MREIKFRGKCKDTDEIVTGNLLVLLNACYIVRPTFFAARDDDPKHFSIFWDQTTKYPSQAAIMVYPVYPDSVAQLVGYDADGKEVYEGDKLKHVDDENYNAIAHFETFIRVKTGTIQNLYDCHSEKIFHAQNSKFWKLKE